MPALYRYRGWEWRISDYCGR